MTTGFISVPSPQGPQALFGATFNFISTTYQVVDGNVKLFCSAYTVDGGKGSLTSRLPYGPFPSFDGTYLYAGVNVTGSNVSSTLYELRTRNASTTTCDLHAVTASTDKEIVKVVKQPSGSFLVAKTSLTLAFKSSSTEVGLLEPNGSYTTLVAPTSAQIGAGVWVSVAPEWGTSRVFITYPDTGKNIGAVYENGALRRVFDSGTANNLMTVDICVSSFSGSIALLCGSNRTVGARADKLVAVNTATGKSTVVSSYDEDIIGAGAIQNYVQPDNATVDKNGVMYFETYNAISKAIRFFKAMVVGITTFPLPTVTGFAASPTAVTAGDAVVLSWKVADATNVAIDQGVGTVALSGSVTVTPTQTTPYSLTATGPGGIASATVTVTVAPKPALPTFTAAGVVNAASFKAPISSGSIATVFGANMAGGTAQASAVPLPTSLTGTQVLVNGATAPLIYVSPGQINFQVPVEAIGASATIQVVSTLGVSSVVTVPLSTTPGLFQGGDGNVIAQDPQGNLLGTNSNPAKAGDVAVVYATGLGPTDCRVETGKASTAALCRTLAVPDVFVGGQKAQVLFSGLTPGFIGLYQINLTIPPQASAATTVPIVAVVNGQKSSDSALIVIAQ